MNHQTLEDRVQELESRVEKLESMLNALTDAPMTQTTAAKLLGISPATVNRRRSEPSYCKAFTQTGRVIFSNFRKIWEASL